MESPTPSRRRPILEEERYPPSPPRAPIPLGRGRFLVEKEHRYGPSEEVSTLTPEQYQAMIKEHPKYHQIYGYQRPSPSRSTIQLPRVRLPPLSRPSPTPLQSPRITREHEVSSISPGRRGGPQKWTYKPSRGYTLPTVRPPEEGEEA